MLQSKEIQERLNLFIKMAGWSKVEFAKKMDKPPNNINRYFIGHSDIQLLSVKLIENGCNIMWLYTGEGNPFSNNEMGTGILKKYKEQLEYLIKNIESPQQ